MNPSKQEMKTLLFMLPRIWQLEGRVAGADLGLGRFQFDFEAEEDIVEVLKMEPLHFDHWVVSLVRWAPLVDPNYPSTITFWIRVLGVPIEYWADQTFREIGEDLGKVEAVDIVGGRIQVTVDGFKPLCFETEIEFGNGEETVMFFQYERLFGFCELCFSLCHDKSVCALNPVTGSGKQLLVAEVITDSLVQSYRGAVSQVARHELNQGGKVSHGSKGKSSMEAGNDVKNQNLSGNNKGALVPQPRQFASYIQFNEHRFSKAGGYGSKRLQTQGMGKTLSESQGQSSKAAVFFQPKQVRKALFSSQETHGDDAAGTAMEVGLEEDSGKGKEIGLNSVEVAGPASVENSVTVTESSLPLKSGAGLIEDGDAEFQKEVSTLMSTDEVDGDDLMDGTVLVSSSCPLDQSHDYTMEDTTSEQMADDDDVEESDHSDMVAAKAEATEADTERSQKQKGPLLLKGVSSKKRNVQLFTSPRKRNAAKGGDQGKEGNNPTSHGTVKGVPGGGKPPKPKVDK
ncbi:unnamed protein product [Arabidopsis arenosa]|uniref:DUF4283 domain-containing protein n=1 Tax=Arabidopsis arenosa TaxID=38785 RepID=A0A8S2A8X8_ARAAE|nr:unnamed protein product [Arabidopsis arenosa]